MSLILNDTKNGILKNTSKAIVHSRLRLDYWKENLMNDNV